MDFDIRRHISGLGANAAGVSNVVMQLSWPEVGYGVKDSKVHSGSAMKHPVKRARTTFTFLAVSMLGTERDRQVFRKAVNGQHAQVVSEPGSPVQYRAMDPHLQLWVAACLYYGTVDINERLHGPLDDETADALYAHCARFGTSLQVRPDMWPPDRAAFDDYWEESLSRVHVDDSVREYLLSLIRYENAPPWVGRLLARKTELMTAGFLPPLFRDQLGLEWDDAREVEFGKRLARIGWLDRHLPEPLRLFPFNWLLWDMRRRHRKGIPLV
ncbi:MAG: hypothetical protein JWO22_611 [Frankiales bacterium]|nr:hypothetical protein [Frankiales bacterium]